MVCNLLYEGSIMAIFKINSFKRLKRLGVKLNLTSAVYVKTFLRSPNGVLVPISLQVTTSHFVDSLPHTFNVEDNVISVVITPVNIFFVPNIKGFQEILLEEGYLRDDTIYVPPIHEDTLEMYSQRRLWHRAKQAGRTRHYF